MKRNSVKLLVAAILALTMVASLAGCGEAPAAEDAIDPAYVAQLEQECVDLRNQLQALTNQIADLEQTVVLKSYALKPVPNDDNSGATVEITAVPMRYQEGQSVLFRVSLDGQEVSTLEGSWDGTAYTAQVDLQAADGYVYECQLVRPDGTQSTIVISSPDSPVYESCVYLQSGLNAYCSMIVEASSLDGEDLILNTAYVQVQLPRIGNRTIEYKSGALVLKMGDTELQRVALDIPAGETESSREAVLSDVRFDLPEDMGDQQLDLWLEVTLSDERVITHNSCSWAVENGELLISAG